MECGASNLLPGVSSIPLTTRALWKMSVVMFSTTFLMLQPTTCLGISSLTSMFYKVKFNFCLAKGRKSTVLQMTGSSWAFTRRKSKEVALSALTATIQLTARSQWKIGRTTQITAWNRHGGKTLKLMKLQTRTTRYSNSTSGLTHGKCGTTTLMAQKTGRRIPTTWSGKSSLEVSGKVSNRPLIFWPWKQHNWLHQLLAQPLWPHWCENNK